MTAVVAAALAVVQALFAISWFGAVRVPAATGGRLVVLAASFAADVAVLATDDSRPMAHVPPVLAGALLAALLHQLARRGGRDELTASLTATTAAAAFAALGAAWLGLEASQEGTALVVLAVLASAAVALADGAARVRHAPPWAAAVAAAVVVLAAAAVVAAASDLSTTVAVLTAAGGAVAARLGVALADRTGSRDPFVRATLPPLLAAPVAYLLARVLTG